MSKLTKEQQAIVEQMSDGVEVSSPNKHNFHPFVKIQQSPVVKGDKVITGEGVYKIQIDGVDMYFPTLEMIPLAKRIRYEIRAEGGKIIRKTTFESSWKGDFQDTDGGVKCGKITSDYDEQTDDEKEINKMIDYTAFVWGLVSGTGTDSTGKKVTLDKTLCVLTRGGVGAITLQDTLSDSKRSANVPNIYQLIINLDKPAKNKYKDKTGKEKEGNYYSPQYSFKTTIDVDGDIADALGIVNRTIEEENDFVMRKFQQNCKDSLDDLFGEKIA